MVIRNANLYVGVFLCDLSFDWLARRNRVFSRLVIERNLFQPGVSSRLCSLAYITHITGSSLAMISSGLGVVSSFYY